MPDIVDPSTLHERTVDRPRTTQLVAGRAQVSTGHVVIALWPSLAHQAPRATIYCQAGV
jgi:hypothetical protein